MSHPDRHDAVGSPGYTFFNTLIPPNSTKSPWSACRTDQSLSSADFADVINANSNHPGGVNMAFADGSVKFLKDTVAQPVYWSLGTKAGGETISADSF